MLKKFFKFVASFAYDHFYAENSELSLPKKIFHIGLSAAGLIGSIILCKHGFIHKIIRNILVGWFAIEIDSRIFDYKCKGE